MDKKVIFKEVIVFPDNYYPHDGLPPKLDNIAKEYYEYTFIMERIETTILRNLIFDEEYSRKVIPFIQPDYFENKTEKIIFEEATQFIVKYDAAITIEALNIEIENRTDLTETEIKEARETYKNI